MTYRQEVAAVKRLTRQIGQSESEAEAAKWERAERLAGLVAAGESRRQVGRDTGLSENTVRAAVRIWELFGARARAQRPRYADADYEAQGRGPGLGQASPQKIAERVAADPATAKAVVTHPQSKAALDDAERRVERSSPPSPAAQPTLPILAAAMTVRRDIKQRLITAAEDVGAGLEGDDLGVVLQIISQCEAGLALTKELLTSGGWDAALASLLDEEVGR